MNLDHIASASSQSIHEKTTLQATPLKNYCDGTLFKIDCIFWNKAENIRLKSKGSLIDTATQRKCQRLCKIKFMVGISLCVMLGLILSVAKKDTADPNYWKRKDAENTKM